MNAELASALSRAEQEDRRRLKDMEATLARQKRLRRFISTCNEDDIGYLASLVRSARNGSSGKPRKQMKQFAGLAVPDYGPTTAKGTPRQRQWGVLRPAIDQAIAKLDHITSGAVYEYLRSGGFEFGAETQPRSVSSIASYLRALEKQGTLVVKGPRGKGAKNIEFTKVKTAKR